MALSMDEKTYLKFYENTILGSSNNQQKYICNLLEEQHLITFEESTSLQCKDEVLYFDSKNDTKNIIKQTTMNKNFIKFYEWWEYIKLYKYSVPFYYTMNKENIIQAIESYSLKKFNLDAEYIHDYILETDIKDVIPTYFSFNDKLFIKFVLQRAYIANESQETIDCRYPITIYIDTTNQILEIRYDAMKYSLVNDNNVYGRYVNFCIDWLKRKLDIKLFECDHANTIDVINDRQNEHVKIYKQMMEMSTGGSAELTASESRDYVLPFVGEIKELIDENSELFNKADEIKQLLLQYLNDKEATASYPYIYIKWLKPVESQSYIVKVTFDYFNNQYTLLQHITGSCKDLGMERMNHAIEYLCKSGSFIKGKEI